MQSITLRKQNSSDQAVFYGHYASCSHSFGVVLSWFLMVGTNEGIEKRFENVRHSTTFRRVLDTYGLASKKMLDLGCSFGEYLVCFGPGSLGVTTTVDEVVYGKTKGLNIIQGNVELIDELGIADTYRGIWANNLFEHLLSPHAFLIRLKKVAGEGDLLILGVDVLPRIVSLTNIKKFRGALATPHVGYYTRETLRLTVAAAGWSIVTLRPFYFSNAFLDWCASWLAPHLFVVAKNDTAFRYPPKKRREWIDDPLYKHMFEVTEG